MTQTRGGPVWSLLALLVVLGMGLASPPGRTQEKSPEAQVDEIFAEWDKPDSPGCAVSVMRDAAIIYRRGYGMANLEYGVPITPSSIFHIASVSKQFTAMAVALLAAQGKLSLDDDVRKHVPEVPDFGQRITVRQLIHHTSGLRDQWELLMMAGWRWEADVVKQADVLEITSRQRALNFAPGDDYLYSNTGYTLLAVIVERLTSKTLREYAEENIFKPLGMTDTHFHDDHQMIVKNRAYAYAPKPGGGFKISIPDFDVVGATSLFTTVEDLARWDWNLYTGRVGGRQVIELMHTRGVLNSGEEIPYAFGLMHENYRGLKTVGHSGGDAGYRSHFLRFPEQHFSVAVLCNFPSSNPGRLAQRVADVYLADKFTEPTDAALASESDAVKLSEAELAQFAGIYQHPAADTVWRLNVKEGKLTLGRGDGPVLLALGQNRFRIKGSSTVVTFTQAGPNAPMQLHVPSIGTREEVYTRVEAAQPTATQLAEYAGTYHSDELNIDYTFVVEEGKLVLKNWKLGKLPLEPTRRDGFSFDGRGLTFTRDAQQRLTGFTLSGGRVRKVRFTKIAE